MPIFHRPLLLPLLFIAPAFFSSSNPQIDPTPTCLSFDSCFFLHLVLFNSACWLLYYLISDLYLYFFSSLLLSPWRYNHTNSYGVWERELCSVLTSDFTKAHKPAFLVLGGLSLTAVPKGKRYYVGLSFKEEVSVPQTQLVTVISLSAFQWHLSCLQSSLGQCRLNTYETFPSRCVYIHIKDTVVFNSIFLSTVQTAPLNILPLPAY